MTRWRQMLKDYTVIIKNTAIAGAACAAVFGILFGVNYLGGTTQQPPVEQFGWAGEEVAAEAWAAIGDQFPDFFIAGQTVSTEDKVVELWREYQAAHGGEHFKANRQVIGDCVAQGARTAICILQGVQAARGPPGASTIKDAHVPYLYGCGRVFVGGGRLGGDGSVGSWQAQSVKEKYGVLPVDAPGAPPYSAAIGRKWGNRPGPPQEFVEIGSKHLVKTTARITTYEAARDAVCNGYPITVASNQGFQGNNGRARSQDGKLWGVPGSSWAHQMCFIGVDDTVECPAWAGGGKGALYCMNSWGPEAHASIQAYRDNGDAPPGGFWVARNVAERMLKAGDSFAYSDFEGFPEQIDFLLIRENVRINRDLFDDVVAVALVFGLGV